MEPVEQTQLEVKDFMPAVRTEQRAAKSLVAIAKKSKSPILRFASDQSQEPLQSLEGRESRMQELWN